MKIFIAGVMQGNKKTHDIHDQSYRERFIKILKSKLGNVEIIDPDKTDPNRLSYTHEQASEMFFRYCSVVSEVDLVISYLPEASMGSAVEMWEAYHAKVPIITISPLKHNWVIKLLSSRVVESIEEFEQALEEGLLESLPTKDR